MAFPANFKKKGKGKLAKKASGKATGGKKSMPPWLKKHEGSESAKKEKKEESCK